MTDKELHRLSRRELLQLLLTQAKDTEALRQLTEEQGEQLESLKNSYEHLKRRLDRKDEQIHELRTALHEERSNRRIELEEAGSIAEAALRLNGIFEMAQKAAEQYLYNIRLLHEKEESRGEKPFEEADLETEEDSKAEEAFESGNWVEETEEPQLPEGDTTEIEPELPEGNATETEPEFSEGDATEAESEFPEEDIAEQETESPQENMAEPETEDQQAAETEEPKRWPRGGKRRARHRK